MSCAAHGLAASRRFLTLEDVDVIRRTVAKLSNRSHLEVADLGAGSGTTALSVFAERAYRIRVTTIDQDEDALNWAEAAIVNIRCHKLWRKRKQLSWVEPFDVDLLLVDACHEYECVLRDLYAWTPHIQDGYIWLHDYNELGVQRAIEQVKLECIEVGGLGYVGRTVYNATDVQ